MDDIRFLSHLLVAALDVSVVLPRAEDDAVLDVHGARTQDLDPLIGALGDDPATLGCVQSSQRFLIGGFKMTSRNSRNAVNGLKRFITTVSDDPTDGELCPGAAVGVGLTRRYPPAVGGSDRAVDLPLADGTQRWTLPDGHFLLGLRF